MRLFRVICWMCAFLGMLHVSIPAQSQSNDPGAQPPATSGTQPAPNAGTQPPPDAGAQPPPNAAPAAPSEQLLKPAELDGLVAPIALYPDTLLANVLMAATYPLEVVQAERWVNQNKNLKGDALKTAAEKQEWDASVKALVAAPSVLQLMSDQLDWTQKLGEAFLAQQQDVMDAVQRMRARAYDRKKLMTTKQQVVTVRQDQNRQFIYIEPAVPDALYVPYYEPQVVFGDWPYADYPAYPYYWGYPGYIGAGLIATGIAFGAAYGLGRWASGRYWGGGGYWGGSRINWGGGAIDVNRGARVEHWQHNPAHRQGARYNNANLQQRFGNANRAGANRPGAGAAANRPGAGNLGQRTDRAGAGRGAADRAANRPAGAGWSAGNRQAANRNRAAGNARQGRAAGRPAGGSASRAGQFRPAAGGARMGGGGQRAAAFHGGGGGFRGGGGGGFRGGGGRGGGRRSDIRLKHDIVLLGRLDNGLGYYRFAYNGSEKPYVGVIAQEVRALRPDAVFRGRDGYLRVYYDRLGIDLQSYDDWVRSGGRLPKMLDKILDKTLQRQTTEYVAKEFAHAGH